MRAALNFLFNQVFTELGLDVKYSDVTVSDRPDLAHYQCNGALPLSKTLKKNPREVATQILDKAKSLIESRYGAGAVDLTIAGPGFINLKLTPQTLAQETDKQVSDARFGIAPTRARQTYVIDMGSPNVAKSMHAGHLRSLIIGDSLQRILRFAGHNVISDDHLGDWGTPMGMLIAAIRERSPELPYFSDTLSGPFPKESPVTIEDLEILYPESSKRFKSDKAFEQAALEATRKLQQGHAGYKALWQHFVDTTMRELNREFATLGLHFDKHLGESFYEEKMPPLVARLKNSGAAVMSEGALVIVLADEADPEMPPLILEKSGGGYLYHTSDMATIEYRRDVLNADVMLYVVDNRQSLHFKQVFKAARLTKLAGPCQLIHTGFGTMNGKDGKPFKTREGGVIKLKDLIQMIVDKAKERLSEMGSDREFSPQETESVAQMVGIATLKYADLKNTRTSDYVFDLDRFSQFEGNTGPYLMYAAVRIQSILKKAKAQGFAPGPLVAPTLKSESDLMFELIKLPDYFGRAEANYEPHHLCDYGFTLSQAFNSFYKECHILGEKDAAKRASWLGLCQATYNELKLVLGLVGITLPDRM